MPTSTLNDTDPEDPAFSCHKLLWPFKNNKFHNQIVFISTLTLLLSLVPMCYVLGKFSPPVPAYPDYGIVPEGLLLKSVKTIRVDSSKNLMSELKDHDLWDIRNIAEFSISPLVIESFPADLNQLDVKTKKKSFLHALLPVALIALEEVRLERETLLTILSKIEKPTQKIFLNESFSGWQKRLTYEEIQFVIYLTRKYRTKHAKQLVNRVNVIPVSLILAQGAIESSWGSSRFANEGNNLFGVWTWGEQGIIPAERELGQNHKVAKYHTILDSVRSYILTLNRLGAYKNLRKIRAQTMDPLAISRGLLYYSERRNEYVKDVQSVINFNRLTEFDYFKLSAYKPFETESFKLAILTNGQHAYLL